MINLKLIIVLFFINKYFELKYLLMSLEEKYVKPTYEIISKHFDHTRHYKWSFVTDFIKSHQKNSLIYNLKNIMKTLLLRFLILITLLTLIRKKIILKTFLQYLLLVYQDLVQLW